MTTAEPQVVTAVRNHWWWRPSWRAGRHFYACHLTLDDQPQLRTLVKQYQDVIGHLPGLDLIPLQWLHITMQGVGFADEIGPEDLAAVTATVQERLRDVQPPETTFDRATIRPEAVILKAEPPEPLYHLRIAVYDAIASVLGPDKFSEPRPGPSQFTPHVSAAYVNSDGPAEPIAEAIADLHPQRVTVTFPTISLLEFHRDRRMYEWTRATPLAIGPANRGAPPQALPN
jgi:2'-5' RNA ligase